MMRIVVRTRHRNLTITTGDDTPDEPDTIEAIAGSPAADLTPAHPNEPPPDDFGLRGRACRSARRTDRPAQTQNAEVMPSGCRT